MSTDRTITLAEFHAEARARFGPDTTRWAYQCPVCSHIAVAADVRLAISLDPVARVRGLTADRVLAQQCVSCLATAREHGTTIVRLEDGRETRVFELAPATTTTEETDTECAPTSPRP